MWQIAAIVLYLWAGFFLAVNLVGDKQRDRLLFIVVTTLIWLPVSIYAFFKSTRETNDADRR